MGGTGRGLGLDAKSPNVGRKSGFGGLGFPATKKNLDPRTSEASPGQEDAPVPISKVSIDPNKSEFIPKKPEGSAGLS